MNKMIEFYATTDCDSIRDYMPQDVAYMLPASSWARVKMRRVRLPAHVTRVAADCGGFVATRIWGDYRYSADQYVKWLETFNPVWAAMMDYCCEKEVAANRGIVLARQKRTTEKALEMWSNYKSASWVWCPTIQGWNVSDYVRHARELKPLILDMQQHYGSEFRVGVGTLCARRKWSLVRQICQAVTTELPSVSLHLWGVKLEAAGVVADLPSVVSVDSGAWNGLFGRDIEKYKASGLRQREYTYKVALPAYLEKFHTATA